MTLSPPFIFSGYAHELTDLLKWVVGLQQQQQQRLFVLKAEVAAYCAHSTSAGLGNVRLYRTLSCGRETEHTSLTPCCRQSSYYNCDKFQFYKVEMN